MKQLTFFEHQMELLHSISNTLADAHGDGNYKYLVYMRDCVLTIRHDFIEENAQFIAPQDEIKKVLSTYKHLKYVIEKYLKDEKYTTF